MRCPCDYVFIPKIKQHKPGSNYKHIHDGTKYTRQIRLKHVYVIILVIHVSNLLVGHVNRSSCTPHDPPKPFLEHCVWYFLRHNMSSRKFPLQKWFYGSFSKWPPTKMDFILFNFLIITESQIWCLNQYFQGPEIQWEHYLANSSFLPGLNGYFSCFQNGCHRKSNIITLLVIDLYKQTWCQNIHFEGPEIQWRRLQVDRIFSFASSGLFDHFLKMVVNKNS